MGLFPIAGFAALLWAVVAVVPWRNRRIAVGVLVFQLVASALMIGLVPTWSGWLLLAGPGGLIAAARLVEIALERRSLTQRVPAVVPEPAGVR